MGSESGPRSVTKDIHLLFSSGQGGERLVSYLRELFTDRSNRHANSRFDGDDLLGDMFVELAKMILDGNVDPKVLSGRNRFADFFTSVLRNKTNERLRNEFYTLKRGEKAESLDDETAAIAASCGLAAEDLLDLKELMLFASNELEAVPQGQRYDVLKRMVVYGEKAREVADSYSANLSIKERTQLVDKFNRWFREFCYAFRAKSEERNWAFKDLES
jgi:hypothetical protein